MKLKKSQIKEFIRQAISEVMSEDKTYKAKHKGGKVVTFKNKDNWKDALKTGEYEKVDSKKVLLCILSHMTSEFLKTIQNNGYS